MIKQIVLILLLVQSFTSTAQSLMMGAGGTYGTDVEQFAVNTRLYYGFNEELCFGPEFSYFPTVGSSPESQTLYELGFVVHYIFELKEKVGLYPLIGVNYSLEKSEHLNVLHTESAFGWALGAGIHYTVRNFMPFLEYKYITGGLSQSTFSLGVIYNLKFRED